MGKLLDEVIDIYNNHKSKHDENIRRMINHITEIIKTHASEGHTKIFFDVVSNDNIKDP